MLTREVPSFPLNYKNVITKAAHIYGRNFRGINNREKIHKICNPLSIDYLFTILGFLHLDAVFVGKKHMQLNAGSYVPSVLKLFSLNAAAPRYLWGILPGPLWILKSTVLKSLM